MKHLVSVTIAAGFLAVATPLHAQLFYVGLRGGAGVPTGSFSETPGEPEGGALGGAKAGLGYGADAGVNLGPFGFYAGLDRISFDCDVPSCGVSDSKYKLQGMSAGVRLSVPLFPFVKPWVKGGVTYNELKVDFGETSSVPDFTTERGPGYEVGAGFDITIAGGFFSITPQVRYVGQKLDYRFPGAVANGEVTSPVNYYTIDVGLRLRSPI
ncbi:MAG: outer membrane beta-barrel protein [Gemmatimonadaceae bacterium]